MSSMKRDVKKKAPPRPEARFRFSICELLPTKDKDCVSSAMFSYGKPSIAHRCALVYTAVHVQEKERGSC